MASTNYTNNLTGLFDGWNIDPDDGFLYDPAGNHYHIDEIRAIFFNRQLIKSLTGTPHDPKVTSLVQYLERKIDSIKLPVITVSWGDGQESKIAHPHL